MINTLSWDNEIDHLKAWGFIELHDHEQRSFLRYVDQGSVYQDWRIFQHENTSRNVISIALRPLEDEDQKYHEVFVQEDAGCDHLVMPFRWSNIDYKWLNALKMSFDGEGLKGERLYE